MEDAAADEYQKAVAAKQSGNTDQAKVHLVNKKKLLKKVETMKAENP